MFVEADKCVCESLAMGVGDPEIPARDPEDEMGVDGEAVVAQAEVAEESSWLTELKQGLDYKSFIAKVRNGEESETVTLPRCAKKYCVADFTIDQGELKMTTETGMATVVPKTRRRTVFDEAH
ncbi:hypothetical protein ANCCAN_17495 [Ancylostoma caninum]|uniref:Uncharacterized protein n=1 Tax=Ancylostoma caninum TaxID=29170 RepID=A0A368FWQ0_ANCCA|nr:hypothetical protein ANCCAN_17495 [Ancylostoma caninum]